MEPGDGREILNGLKHVRPGNGFEPNFEFTRKVQVNGKDEEPIYSFLKKSCPSPRKQFTDKKLLNYDPLHSRDIRWNFEKFLIAPWTGQVFRRYDHSTPVEELVEDITRLTHLPHPSDGGNFFNLNIFG